MIEILVTKTYMSGLIPGVSEPEYIPFYLWDTHITQNLALFTNLTCITRNICKVVYLPNVDTSDKSWNI